MSVGPHVPCIIPLFLYLCPGPIVVGFTGFEIYVLQSYSDSRVAQPGVSFSSVSAF